MPPPDLEDFDAYAKRRGWAPPEADEPDDFDAYAARRGWAPAEEPEAAPEGATPAEPADEPGIGESWLDALIGYEDGQLLGNTKNIARLADRAPELADAVHPALGGAARAAHALAPNWVDELAELTDSARETTAGKVGGAAGTAATSLGLGVLAGPGVAGQAAAGAGLSGAQALGETDGDWLAALAATPAGAGFAAAGGALAGRVGARPTMKDYGTSALWGASLGAATSPTDPIRGAARGAGTSVLGRGLLAALPRSAGAPIRAAGQLAAAGAGTASGALAQGVPEVAYGTAPTMAWAVQSVLASGDSGLSAEDEQRMHDALMDGDEDKVISANFALQMKNPGWSARLQRELESLHEEE